MFRIETNKYLKQPLYLFTKTWKYGGSVFGTEVAEELKQSNPLNVIGIFSSFITITFSLIIMDSYMQLLMPNDSLCGKHICRRMTNSKTNLLYCFVVVF